MNRATVVLCGVVAWIGMAAHLAAQPSGVAGNLPAGAVSREQVVDFVASEWRKLAGFESASADREGWRQAVAEIGSASGRPLELDVFFGTWCHDSEREIPHLLDIFDELERGRGSLPFEVHWFVVDEAKSQPAEEIETYQVRQLPTLILSRRDAPGRAGELGRIVQRPPRGLETDLKRLVDGSARGLVSASETAIREYMRPGSEAPDSGANVGAIFFDTSQGIPKSITAGFTRGSSGSATAPP